MKEVAKNLFCGNDMDFYRSLLCLDDPPRSEMELLMCMPEGWAVVHAAKEPYHRMALGYTSKGAPKDHPDYLWSERMGNRLALNMVDAPKQEFFDKSMIKKALSFIEQKLGEGFNVLVHCNIGESRAASLCLLYLVKHGIISGTTFDEAESEMMQIYPAYNPGEGIRAHLMQCWGEY
ncbi:MAG: Phage protein [Firmicutes bacterium]|nr:Phage protein [Bacillota bacterium]